MHQSQTIRTTHNLLQLLNDLLVIGAGENSHDHGHRPRVAGSVMGPTDGGKHWADHVVGVLGGEDQGARGLVDGIVGGEVAEEGEGEEGGDIGVVLKWGGG